MSTTDYADYITLAARLAGLPEPVTEYRFAPPRRWRFDFAWPQYRIAVEVEGGIWIRGRHTRGKGYAADLEKYNAATAMGWRVFRFTPEQVREVAPVASALRALLQFDNDARRKTTD